MSLKTTLIVLVLGSSSAALAHPIDVRDHRDDVVRPIDVRDHRDDFAHPIDVRDHRDDSDVSGFEHRMPWMRRPVLLATGVSITSDFRDHRAERPLFIDVDNHRMGGIAKLRFDQTMGTTFIDSIVVMLPNGYSRTYSVRQWLSARTPSIVVDLDQRAITGIYVYGSSMRRRGAFDVVGLRR